MSARRNLVIGALGTGLVLGVVRFTYRYVFRETATVHESSTPCGQLVLRTRTVTRERPFEERPTLESENHLEGPNGELASGVRVTACEPLRNRFAGALAVVVGEGREVRVFDAAKGATLAVVPVSHTVDALAWSPDGARLAAIGGGGDGAVTMIEPGAVGPANVLARDPNVAATGYVWSKEGRFCWLLAQRAAASDGFAELWCWSPDAAAAKVTRRAWAGADAHPWAAFRLGRGEPIVCGDELRPRDPECFGVERPR